MCTVAINVLEPRAFNAESQYFIPLFNKISWLCGQQSGGDQEGMKHQMGGASQAQQGMTFHNSLVFTFYFSPWEPDPSQNVRTGVVLRLSATWEPSFRFSWRFSYPVLYENRTENWRRFSAGGWEPPNTGLQVVQQVGDKLLGIPLGNIVGNIWGTWWEHREKKIPSSPLAPPKRKNEHTLGCMFSISLSACIFYS